MIEKRVPANKEYLVQVTEQAVQNQIITFTQNASAKDDNQDRKEDEN